MIAATDKLIVAVPSKGRLQENANAFFARAGIEVTQGRGARDYRGSLIGVDNAEAAFLSASEITARLADGDVHLGVTGEDLVRETIADAESRVELLAPWASAAPMWWSPCRRPGSTCATWPISPMSPPAFARATAAACASRPNMCIRRAASSPHMRSAIIASSRAPAPTEGAPAAGSADLIVDITTTGATLAANALKTLDDGVILRSQANLVASLSANWTARAKEAARVILSRIAAEELARTTREIRTQLARARRRRC